MKHLLYQNRSHTIVLVPLFFFASIFQSTVLKRRPGFENICHVTGFVTKDLDTLEERRLVIVRNHHQLDDLHLGSATIKKSYFL